MNAQSSPLISVCIANYNGEDFICECIESVLNQVDAPSFEVIVHDDASTDGSLRLVRHYPQVSVLASDRNVGFCVSNNRMAAASTGRYLLLLNNDAVLEPDALRVLLADATNSTDDPILSLAQHDYDSGALLDCGFLLDPFANPVPVRYTSPEERAMVMGSCLWISRLLWDRIGGFPEWIESIGEDLYLCCYARILGHCVRVSTKSSYRHRVGQSFGGGKVRDQRLSSTINRRALSERNKMFVLLIFLPMPLLMLIIPLHAICLLTEGVVLAIWHRAPHLVVRIHVAAIVAPLSRLGVLCRYRRRAQANRVASWRKILAPTIWTPWKLRLLWRHGIPSVR